MSIDSVAASKSCCDCKVVKSFNAFFAEPRNRDGRAGRCKACCQARRKSATEPPASYEPPTSKVCTGCGIDKPLSAYSPDRRNWDGRQSRYQGCDLAQYRDLTSRPDGKARIQGWEKRSKLKYRYGITPDEYEQLLAAQGGTCAICDRPPPGGPKGRRLHVDHDHGTGKVRGLLCPRCNVALGLIGDSLDAVAKFAGYLSRSAD